MTQWLRISRRHGEDYYQVVYDYKTGTEYLLGEEQYIEISDAEAGLAIDMLVRLYKAEKAEAVAAAAKKAKQAELKGKLAELEERVTRIIKESNQVGEVENAKVFYEKITGRPWKDGGKASG